MNRSLPRLILLCLFFLIAGRTAAQRFTAGLISGISATQVSGDNLGGFDKPGLMLGGLVQTPLSEKIRVSMEILYIQKGSKKNANPEHGDYTYYKLKLNYFEVPLLIQYHTPKRFTFETGLTFGGLLSSSELYGDENGDYEGEHPFKKFEFGFLIGMKVNFAHRWSFVTRFENSILSVRDYIPGITYETAGQYNSALIFGFQYTFLKKQEE